MLVENRLSETILNPATRLIVRIVLLLAVQGLSGMILALVVASVPLLGVKVLRLGWRLIWRTRWLLLSLLVIFSWGVPGEALWNSRYAPTHEGLLEGVTHLGRLLLVLFGLAAIQQSMSFNDLLAATHTLLQPLRAVGIDPDRGVVRLMLVIRYVDALPRPRDWRTLLDAPVASEIEALEIRHDDFGLIDALIVIFTIIALVLFWLYLSSL